jgi:hypothetical protein
MRPASNRVFLFPLHDPPFRQKVFFVFFVTFVVDRRIPNFLY